MTNLHACEGKPVAAPVGSIPTAEATIGGQLFRLEVADTDEAIDRGLSGRTSVDKRGGMLFVFPTSQVRSFVMRDCAMPIDLLYLDEAGGIVDVFAMTPEAPRGPGESAGDPAQDGSYMARLRAYISSSPARYAIEVRGGTINELRLSPVATVTLKLP